MFDFGIGSSELVIIAVVALIVIGPKDLPKVLRTIGQFTTKMRGMAREFQRHLDEATREAGLDEVKDDVSKMTNFTVTDVDKTGDDIKKAIEDTAVKPASSSGNGAAAEVGKPAESKPAESKPAKTKSAKSKPAKSKSAGSAASKTVAAGKPAASEKAGKAAG